MADGSAIEWTEVPGHPGYYASRAGEIRGPSGRILRPMANNTGHRYVITSARRKLWVHHAVLLAFVGPRPVDQEGRHLDDDPDNNTLDNLAWGTRRENAADRITNGRTSRGEQRPNARLSSEQAQAIRVDTRPARAIGAEYGVSHTCVLRIRRGERWAAA